jgi:hypothetical protein
MAARTLTILASFLAAPALSCGGGPSEDDITNEFAAYVAGANACAATSDCQLVFPGCPLGCSAAVRVDRAADVMMKANSLVQQYESSIHSACEYSCASTHAVCTQSRCAVEIGAP